MSIVSSIYAGFANDMKDKWVERLESILCIWGHTNPEVSEMVEDIEKVIKEMDDHHFGE